MARTIGKLTALKVDKAKQPGMYGDGGGLYLRVTEDGAKNWVFRLHAERPAAVDGHGAAAHGQSCRSAQAGRRSIACDGMTASTRSMRAVPNDCKCGSMRPSR